MGSLSKKIRTVVHTGFDPIIEGRRNYNRNIKAVEAKALERSEVCRGCTSNVKEPLESAKAKDARIVHLSDRMCDECGCPLAYLLRQDKKVCTLWVK